MMDAPDETITKALIKGLRTLEFAKLIDDASNSYAVGEDIDFYEVVRNLVQDFEKDIRSSIDSDWCKASVEDIIKDEISGVPLKFPLACLQGSMPNMKTGQQIILAARPGKGKTSFCAHACTNFAKDETFKDLGRPIIWFNNESKAIRIKGTCIRSALGKSTDQIIEAGWTTIEEEYNQAVGKDTIRILDVHGRDHKYLERIIEEQNPIVVVWDMLDNVRGFSNSKRDDQRLEKLYQWARECSVIYDFLSIPTSQISDAGSNTMYVPDTYLKDSRTGKQGACDAIIMLGSIDKQGFENSRFINIPKTKFSPLTGFSASCKTEVVFNPDTANFLNPKVK